MKTKNSEEKNYYNKMAVKYGTTNLQTIDAIVKAIYIEKQKMIKEIEKIIKKEIVATRERGWTTSLPHLDNLIIEIKQTLTK